MFVQKGCVRYACCTIIGMSSIDFLLDSVRFDDFTKNVKKKVMSNISTCGNISYCDSSQRSRGAVSHQRYPSREACVAECRQYVQSSVKNNPTSLETHSSSLSSLSSLSSSMPSSSSDDRRDSVSQRCTPVSNDVDIEKLPMVLSVRRSNRRSYSEKEDTRAKECLDAIESIIADCRRTFVGLECLQLNSFEIIVNDEESACTKNRISDAFNHGDDLIGIKVDNRHQQRSTTYTTFHLGNYSHLNNKLSANIRSHLSLNYPMYQSTEELGYEHENREQKLLKRQLLELEMYNNADILTKNQSIIAGRSSESVLRHELGHAIQYKVLGITDHPEYGTVDGMLHSDSPRDMWRSIFNARKLKAEELSTRIEWGDNENAREYFLLAKIGEGVSVYGGTDQLELFAESWTIYSHPEYGKSVRYLPEDIHNYFVTHLPRRNPRNFTTESIPAL